MRGLNTCQHHQGRNGKVKHLAAVAAQRGDAVAGRVARVVPLDVHPADALLHEVRYFAGLCAWLDQVVEGLEQASLVWGLTRRIDQRGGEFPGATTVEAAGMTAWVEWHARAHRHLTWACEVALRAEVDAAAVGLQRAQGMQAFHAFQKGLQQLGLSQEQWARAREVMPQVMRELAAA